MKRTCVYAVTVVSLLVLGSCNSDPAPMTIPTAGAGASAGTSAGSTAGTPMPAAGASGSGSGGSTGGDTTMTCAGATTTGGAALHAALLPVLIPPAADAMNKAPCAFSACHNTSTHKAMLVLETGTTDLRGLLVDKPACEAPNLKLIDGRGGDMALKNSWLWLKLVAPTDQSGMNIVPDTSWGTPGGCNQATPGTYGWRMPYLATEPLPKPKLDAIRNWICGGAPGPT